MSERDGDVPVIRAPPTEPDVALDPAGYFLVVPEPADGHLRVEQYATDDEPLAVVVGETAVDVYRKLIEDGRVTELTHAAYLGKELARAELSIECGFDYVQGRC